MAPNTRLKRLGDRTSSASGPRRNALWLMARCHLIRRAPSSEALMLAVGDLNRGPLPTVRERRNPIPFAPNRSRRPVVLP